MNDIQMNDSEVTAPVRHTHKVVGNGNGNGNSPDPKLRRRRRLHRYIGLSASLFLILLVTTGLLLQHEEDLSLDSRFVGSEVLLSLYAIQAPEDYAACRIPSLLVAQLGHVLFLQPRSVASSQAQEVWHRFAQPTDDLVGCVNLEDAVLIATRNQLILFTRDGRFIETLRLPQLLKRIGWVAGSPIGELPGSTSSLNVILETRQGILTTDEQVLALSPRSELPAGVRWSEFQSLNQTQLSALQSRYLDKALSWQQVLRDVHSGQILGIWGRLLIDLVALVVLLLALTGIGLWWRSRNLSRTG